jgi:hypothetical protein
MPVSDILSLADYALTPAVTNSSKNLKSVIIANSIPGRNKLSILIIIVFLAIYLAILKLIESGIILNISLVVFLYLISTRKRSL